MENYLKPDMDKRSIDAISNLGLAHMGDGVYEVMVRTWLCAHGDKTVAQLHKQTVALVKAPAQAAAVEKLLPHLTEEDLAYYRRGKNSHVHAVPKGATPAQYAKATGLEALFGALWLFGRTDRLDELFRLIMDGTPS